MMAHDLTWWHMTTWPHMTSHDLTYMIVQSAVMNLQAKVALLDVAHVNTIGVQLQVN